MQYAVRRGTWKQTKKEKREIEKEILKNKSINTLSSTLLQQKFLLENCFKVVGVGYIRQSPIIYDGSIHFPYFADVN